VDAAHREVTGGEGLDGHLRELTVPDTAVFRTHPGHLQECVAAIGRGGGVLLGRRNGGIVEVPRPPRSAGTWLSTSGAADGRIQPQAPRDSSSRKHMARRAALHLGRNLSAPLGRARLRPRSSRRFSTAT
jgi:hypothetical protein